MECIGKKRSCWTCKASRSSLLTLQSNFEKSRIVSGTLCLALDDRTCLGATPRWRRSACALMRGAQAYLGSRRKRMRLRITQRRCNRLPSIDRWFGWRTRVEHVSSLHIRQGLRPSVCHQVRRLRDNPRRPQTPLVLRDHDDCLFRRHPLAQNPRGHSCTR